MKKIFTIVFSFMLLVGIFSLSDINLSGYALETETKSISNADEFISVMEESSNYENENIEIKLTCNIDLDGKQLNNSQCGKFKGVFDGNGFTISNITISSSNQYFALIPQAEGATIKNVRINGKIEYLFDPANVSELFVGALVGYGEDVNFLNCELDNSTQTNTKNEINLQVYSNINFGGLCGKIRQFKNLTKPNIENCVNYYNVKINLIKDCLVTIGGLVGYEENSFMLNNLSFGNVEILSEKLSKSNNEIYLGGIVGGITGSRTFIRNCIYGGGIKSSNSLNLFKGAIIGGALSKPINSSNVNFAYYSDLNLKPSGDNFLQTSEFIKIATINKDFLLNSENFDPANPSWDFEKTWTLIDSRFRLQNFQTFDFAFNQILDSNKIIDTATFSKGEESEKFLTARFDDTVKITLSFQEQHYGYYMLSSILLNNNTLRENYTAIEILNEQGEITGYEITLKANAVTTGSYSFEITPKPYYCIVTVSEQAKETKEGGILIDSGSSPSFKDTNLTFYKNSRERKILAVGQGIFSFDYWQLWFKDEDGKFTEQVDFDNFQESGITIEFGTAPFNREFKLVAYFTSEDAIRVDFGQYQNKVSSITFGGNLYEGQPLPVSANSTQSLEVVLEKDYVLDVDAFTRDIKVLYGNNPTTTLITSEPTKNEDGKMVYKFSINMRYISQFDNNSLKFSFIIRQDKTQEANKLLWLYITLPIVIVLITAVVTFILIRKRRGGGNSHNDTNAKVKTKKVSYKDYY